MDANVFDRVLPLDALPGSSFLGKLYQDWLRLNFQVRSVTVLLERLQTTATLDGAPDLFPYDRANLALISQQLAALERSAVELKMSAATARWRLDYDYELYRSFIEQFHACSDEAERERLKKMIGAMILPRE